MREEFVNNVINHISSDKNFLGLAIGGSWITNEIDAFSDLDLVLVSEQNVSNNAIEMKSIADKLGILLNSFTGEHVGEPRLLICLYDNPLLHVDIKFIVLDEFRDRVENPTVVWERDNCLSQIIDDTKAEWPKFDCQWIEDRFWIWIHYACLKIGRGELFEAYEFLSFLRTNVIGPMLQIKNGLLPRGVRKVEFNFPESDQKLLLSTLSDYSRLSIIQALDNLIQLYNDLSHLVFPDDVNFNKLTKIKTLEYYQKIKCDVQ